MKKTLAEIYGFLNIIEQADKLNVELKKLREADEVTIAEAIALDYTRANLWLKRERARMQYADSALESEEFMQKEIETFSKRFYDIPELTADKDMLRKETIKELKEERNRAQKGIDRAYEKISEIEEYVEIAEVKTKINKLMQMYGIIPEKNM